MLFRSREGTSHVSARVLVPGGGMHVANRLQKGVSKGCTEQAIVPEHKVLRSSTPPFITVCCAIFHVTEGKNHGVK